MAEDEGTTRTRDWVNNLPDCGTKLRTFSRDSSLKSIDSQNSTVSTVDSVLKARQMDAEALLRDLGFGPSPKDNPATRIPTRFLTPSKLLPHLDFQAFLEQQGIPVAQLNNNYYRNPYQSPIISPKRH